MVKKVKDDKPEGYVFGRPTKYKKEYCQVAVDFLGGGKSIIQLSKKLSVNKDTLYEWADKNKDFSDALSIGRDYSQSHWEDKLEKMMYSKEINAPLVKLYFANRFRWTDKAVEEKETTSEDMQPITKIEIEVIGANIKD